MIYNRIVHDSLKQRSDEWFEIRMGKFTSSSIYKLFTPPTIEERSEQALMELNSGKWKGKGVKGEYSSTEINRSAKIIGIVGDNLKEAKKSLKGISPNNSAALLILDFCEAFINVHVFSKGAKTYILEKASDFIYFDTQEIKPSADMLRGIIDEDYAKQAYIDKHNLKNSDVMDVGFVDIGFGKNEEDIIFETGSSPDLLVKENGLLEIKCPSRINHMKNIMYVNSESELKKYHENYWFQIHHQLWSTDRDWCNWMSFDRTLTDSQIYYKLAMHFVLVQRNIEVDQKFEKVIPLACSLRDEFTEILLKGINNKL